MKRSLLFKCLAIKLLGLAVILLSESLLPGAIIFILGGGIVMAHILDPRAQGLCDVVTAFRPRGNEVWLTIDDGPDAEDTPRILDLLDQHEARATFFMIGENAERHPDLVQLVLSRGHAIGCHTHTHPIWSFWFAGPSRVARELDSSLDVLSRAGAAIRLFRPPVGIKNLFLSGLLAARGLTCIAWSIRSGDGLSGQLDFVVRQVLGRVCPGSIILMHEGKGVAGSVRIEALASILQGLKARRLRCVLPEPAAYSYSESGSVQERLERTEGTNR